MKLEHIEGGVVGNQVAKSAIPVSITESCMEQIITTSWGSGIMVSSFVVMGRKVVERMYGMCSIGVEGGVVVRCAVQIFEHTESCLMVWV